MCLRWEAPKANELVEELEALRRKVAELEAAGGDQKVEQALLDSERRYRVLYAVSELIGQPVPQVFPEADRYARFDAADLTATRG